MYLSACEAPTTDEQRKSVLDRTPGMTKRTIHGLWLRATLLGFASLSTFDSVPADVDFNDSLLDPVRPMRALSQVLLLQELFQRSPCAEPESKTSSSLFVATTPVLLRFCSCVPYPRNRDA